MTASNSSVPPAPHLLDKMRRSPWAYRVVGPTALHLQYEMYLLLCLTLLTIGSMQGLYQESFGLPGDYFFLSFVVLWLSRHLIFRLLCTWEPSTCRSPTIRGFVGHFLTSHLTGGQTFDRPTTKNLAKQHAFDAGWNFFSSSLVYLVQILRIWIWFPLTRRLQGSRKRQSAFAKHYAHVKPYRSSPSTRHGPNSIRRFLSVLMQYSSYAWNSYGPTLQFLIPLATTCFLFWNTYCMWYGRPDESKNTTFATRNRNTRKESEDHLKPYGAYRDAEEPTWTAVFLYLVTFSTLLSLFFFHRVILPIPDQVAGNNAVKDIRNESRMSSFKSSRSSKIQKEQQDAPWTERSKSIVSENRFRLHLNVSVARVLENLFVCVFLPRTTNICRATKHCPVGAEVWELTRILYPAGITTPLREDGWLPTGARYMDFISWLWTIVGVTAVSCLLLLAQTVLLNKTYLAVAGYISSEWTVVDETVTPTPSAWDPRRRYKKGDMVSYEKTIYRAMSNSPEGRPLEKQLQTACELARNELGHPATSELLSKAAAYQVKFACGYAALWFFYKLMGDPGYGLTTALFANILAAHAILSVGTTNYYELQQLNAEISAS